MKKHFITRKPTAAFKSHGTSIFAGCASETKSNLFLLEGKSGRARCRTVLTKFMAVILFIFPFTSCESSERPVEVERLPFGVFPLNDVKWVEISSSHIHKDENGMSVSITFSNTHTHFVRQTGENRAELYSSTKTVIQKSGFDLANNTKVEFEDSIYTTDPKLTGWILIEDQKVYYQAQSSENKQLMFDYNVREGDTLDWLWRGQLMPEIKFYVKSIDSTLIGNEYRRQYHIKNLPFHHFNESLWIIEGIGCINSFFYTLRYPMPDDNTSIYGVYYKDKLIWSGLIWDYNRKGD